MLPDRKTGGKLAKSPTSATTISEEIHLKEAVYMYCPFMLPEGNIAGRKR
jgi:hypothetical protein